MVLAFLVVSRLWKYEVDLFVYIQPFSDDDHPLADLWDTIVCHIHLVEFDVIANIGEIFQYGSDDFAAS